LDFTQSYFSLFELPQQYQLDTAVLSQRYRQLQQQLHPDRYAHAGEQELRLAVQYSSFVNEAYATLRYPLSRALYLLKLAGMDEEAVAAQQVDGSFLIQQMELREKLETFHDLVDPDTVMEHLLQEISADLADLEQEAAAALGENELVAAATAVVKMQYLDKLRTEAEQREAQLLDS
jgi:molecular chaperone HscB